MHHFGVDIAPHWCYSVFIETMVPKRLRGDKKMEKQIKHLEAKIYEALVNGDDSSDLEAILILFIAGNE